jgi:hypothetical protein
MGHPGQGHQEPDAVAVMGQGPQPGVERFELRVDGAVEPQEAIHRVPGVVGEVEVTHQGQPLGCEEPPSGTTAAATWAAKGTRVRPRRKSPCNEVPKDAPESAQGGQARISVRE